MSGGIPRGGLAAAIGAWLLASPCAAMSWSEFVASFGAHEPPATVLDYLKNDPLAQAAPRPLFSEISTETVDGSVAQHYRLTGFEAGFGQLEGVREEHSQGTARSGQQTVSMMTAMGGLVLVAFDNKTTGAYVVLRNIELSGALFPPKDGGQATMRYERVQLAESAVVEEFRDCSLTWIAPLDDPPKLASRCSGTTKISQPASDGSVKSSSAKDNLSAVFVFRRDLGWLFDQRTKVLDFKRADP
jgi:hypothetical protein